MRLLPDLHEDRGHRAQDADEHLGRDQVAERGRQRRVVVPGLEVGCAYSVHRRSRQRLRPGGAERRAARSAPPTTTSTMIVIAEGERRRSARAARARRTAARRGAARNRPRPERREHGRRPGDEEQRRARRATAVTSVANRFVLPRQPAGTIRRRLGASTAGAADGSAVGRHAGRSSPGQRRRSRRPGAPRTVGSIGRPRRVTLSRIQASGIGRNHWYRRNRKTPGGDHGRVRVAGDRRDRPAMYSSSGMPAPPGAIGMIVITLTSANDDEDLGRADHVLAGSPTTRSATMRMTRPRELPDERRSPPPRAHAAGSRRRAGRGSDGSRRRRPGRPSA